MKHQKDTNSYMQLCFYQEGKGNIYLMVPTYWDEPHKEWCGFVKTPLTGKLLYSSGKNSEELQNNFNVILHESLQDSCICDEVFSMFKPLEYWETRL